MSALKIVPKPVESLGMGERRYARRRDRVYPVRITRHTRGMYAVELEAWIAHLRAAGQSVGTIRLRRAHVERCLSWLEMGPHDVAADDLVRYMAAHEWAPETRKSMRSSLRAFFGWLVDDGRLDVDPARKLPSVSVPSAVPHPTPTPVVDVALERADERTLLMVKLAAYAGLRRAEIAGLHSDDLVGDTLVVCGKGGKTREVPAHPILVVELGKLPRGYVFPGRDHGHLSPDRVGRLMANVLGDGWTAHSLRHRFATRAYAAERDLLTVQQLLGHSSVATTQRYTQVPDDARRRAVDAVA